MDAPFTANHIELLVEARARYGVSATYDEVLSETAARIENTSSVGKSDIGALLFWKRLRADTKWVRKLMEKSDADVREVTRAAVTAVNDMDLPLAEAASKGRSALTSLPGFVRGDALASAVLFAAAPKRMAVYDKRAHRALSRELGVKLSDKPGRYARYMSIVDALTAAVNTSAVETEWIARDVDLALYTLGNSRVN